MITEEIHLAESLLTLDGYSLRFWPPQKPNECYAFPTESRICGGELSLLVNPRSKIYTYSCIKHKNRFPFSDQLDSNEVTNQDWFRYDK